MNKQAPSPHFQHAQSILRENSGHPMSADERKKVAVELAAHILLEAYNYQTPDEKKEQAKLHRMMQDPIGKPFTMAITDQCFRPKSPERIADQMLYLLDLYGIPSFLPPLKKIELALFRSLGRKFPSLLVPLAIRALRKETERVIIPAERAALAQHLSLRAVEKVRVNINHLGEAILGEEEAKNRLKVYLDDLRSSDVNYVSIKISTIYSQINLASPETTIDRIANRLRKLYQAAIDTPYRTFSGEMEPKFVNLDMEEYKDLHLTKDLFMKVLSEPQFHTLEAGIVLQAYLPDAFAIQQELTEWARKRVEAGGAPIKIRLVKGANMALEQFEASLRDWPQTPYLSKIETDANYKRMVTYALQPDNARVAHIGIGSHNLFDIAYAMLLRVENGVEKEVIFEMLEGMANHTRKVVQDLTGGMLLYCPVATKEDFQSAIAYLIRRLDENTGAENFLRHSFGLMPGSEEWDNQVQFFFQAVEEMEEAPAVPRRTQNRNESPGEAPPLSEPFANEPDTDFALPHNAAWAKTIVETWQKKEIEPIPCIVNGQTHLNPTQEGHDPSAPHTPSYHYTHASFEEIEPALSPCETWKNTPALERCQKIAAVAHLFRHRRADLIGAAMRDGGKTLLEADIECSEAIDFGEYYARSMEKIDSYPDLENSPKGTILVAPPWNFPLAIPAGGLFATLVTGNTVLFKPAPEATLIGWELVKLFWEAGIPQSALHFIPCADDPTGTTLIKDPRLNTIILTGGTETARLFHKLRPGIDLYAETGGKNALIVTAMADRDLAIKAIVDSAFGHAGQKCSAASVLILEKELYRDRHFLRGLRDAAHSLHVGSQWNLKTKVPPIIRAPEKDLYKGLTTLEEGEKWLLQPTQPDPDNENLWTPGIKIGVKRSSYTHRTEFFGPLLAIIEAENLRDAIQIANSTQYGLTAGLHSLDEREQEYWQRHIVAGNCYINRTITGAIVERQPFGGTKKSSFGAGFKAGGPNYLTQFLHFAQKTLPKEKQPVNDWVNRLSRHLEKLDLTAEELGTWYASIANYAFWWQRFQRDRDPTKIVGQDNLFRYVPQRKVVLRITPSDAPLDYLRLFAAALTCEYPLHVSWDKCDHDFPPAENWNALLPFFNITQESEDDFVERIRCGDIRRVRLLHTPSPALLDAASHSAAYIDTRPVMANGRLELLTFLREVALSIDYHRYGNLGLREGELRKPLT